MADNDAAGGCRDSVLAGRRVYGIGVDVIEIVRINRFVTNHSSMLQRVFTTAERNLISNPLETSAHLSSRIFAMKEAILKACRVGWQEGVSWNDMEIMDCVHCHEPLLTGKLSVYVKSKKICRVLAVSSVNRFYAVAQAIALM